MKHMTNKHLKRKISAALAACCMTVSAVIPTTAMLSANAAYSTGTYTVSGQSANIRETPGDSILGYAVKGSTFSVSKIDDSWGYSDSIPATNGKKIAGWIFLENCALTSTPSDTGTSASYAVGSKVQIANTNEVNFRTGASTSYSKIGTIPRDTVLTVMEVSGAWLRVNYNGKDGWFKSTYCKAYVETTVTTTVAKVGDKVEVANTDNVNFRTGAGTGYALLGTIPRGTVLTVSEVSGKWFRVNYNGKDGWFSSDYAKKYTEPVQPSVPNTNNVAAVGDKVEITNTDVVNFRSGAGTTYSKIGTIPRGTVLTVLEISGNWFRVTYNNQNGWFSSGYCKKYVEQTQEPTTNYAKVGEKVKVTAPNAVNMRSGAGTGHALLGTIPRDAVLTVEEVTADGWYRVTYEGTTGWFTSRYAEKYTETTPAPSQPSTPSGTIAAGTKVKINAAVAVNLRTGASTSYKVLGTIPRGAVVTVLEASNGWFRTEYNGKTGWFVSQYCEKYEEQSPTPSTPSTEQGFKVNDKVKIVAPSSVNLRSGVGTEFVPVDVIPNGTSLVVEEVVTDWVRVTYAGKTGWIMSRYVVKQDTEINESVPAAGKVTVSAAVSVTLRKEPTASSAAIGWIKGGTVLQYSEISNGWYKVVYNGKTGWISGRYAKAN